MSICQLCLQDRELCNSHIIPEFFFKLGYDEKHRTWLVSTSTQHRDHFVQQGIREKLLCQECETARSVCENYMRGLLLGSKDVPVGRDGNRFFGVDYARVRLFQLSVLWLASVAEDRYFREVDLGPHEEELRKMLVAENPGRMSKYPCLMSALLHEQEAVKGLIIQPVRTRSLGHICYRFVFGGMMWAYLVSKHDPPAELLDWVIREDGTMRMFANQIRELPFIQGMVGDLVKAGKLPSKRGEARP